MNNPNSNPGPWNEPLPFVQYLDPHNWPARAARVGISDSFYMKLHSGTISSAIYVGSLMVCGGSKEQMSIEQTSTEDIRTQLLSNWK
jgi:hypothetical protein